jgi:chemotaxis protein MotB
MARRKRDEEHTNHESWAIPYGDLITLLLAFFVVMYAMSSVNEGKYRILSDSLNAAFQGEQQSSQPVPVGRDSLGPAPDLALTPTATKSGGATLSTLSAEDEARLAAQRARAEELARVDAAVRKSLASLIDDGVVVVKRNESLVEVTIRTDILFTSGSAELAPVAVAPLQQLAATLAPLPNPVRVEGHTDDRPISTAAFPSNWELSAARAASVVRVMKSTGLDAQRLAVVGMGEFRPLASNATADGRNANRRVALVILATGLAPEGAAPASVTGQSPAESATPVTTAATARP